QSRLKFEDQLNWQRRRRSMPVLTGGLCAAAATATLLAGITFAQAAGVQCPEEQGLRSERGDQPAEITFVNKRSDVVRVYWITYEGSRKLYAEIQPQQEHAQRTYLTHPWIVTDRQENCLGVYLPYPHGRHVVID